MMYVVYFESCGGYFVDEDFGKFDNAADAWAKVELLEQDDNLAYDEGYVVVAVEG